MRAMNDRYGLAPVSLTVERPVLHFVLNACLAYALFLKVFKHLCNGVFFIRHTVKEAGVDHFSVLRVCFLRYVAALDDLDYINSERLCKIVVALIVRRNSHNRARAVAHHNVIRYVYRNFLAVYGVYRADAVKPDTRLILYKLRALEFRLFRAFGFVCLNGVDVLYSVLIFFDNRMLRRHNHERNAEERIGTGCINAELFVNTGECEVHKRTGRLAYPVYLLLLDVRQIVDLVKTGEEPVRIFCYAKIPYVL